MPSNKHQMTVLAAIFTLMFVGCGPSQTALKAKADANEYPSLCKETLRDEKIRKNGIELESEDATYQWSLYFTCLEQEAIKNPGICSNVLAAGFPNPSPDLTKNQNVHKLKEYMTCKNFVSNSPEVKSASLLNFDDDVYDGNITHSNVVLGRIQSAQVENISTMGSVGGSQLGSGVGQIAYIESKKNLNGYSPWSQLGIGIAGAVIGSSLDQPGKVQYRKTYWIKTVTGDFVSFGHVEVTPGTMPETMCVAVIDKSKIMRARENLCKII